MGTTPPPLNHPQETTCHTHTLPPIHQNALAPTPQPQKQPLEVDFKPPKIEICTKVHNALTRANNRFPHIPKHPKTTPPRTHPAPLPKTPKNSQTHPTPTHPSTQNTITDPKTAPNPPQKQPIEVDFQPQNTAPPRKTQNALTRENITLPHIPKHPKTHPTTNTPKRKRKTRAKNKKGTPHRVSNVTHTTPGTPARHLAAYHYPPIPTLTASNPTAPLLSVSPCIITSPV